MWFFECFKNDNSESIEEKNIIHHSDFKLEIIVFSPQHYQEFMIINN